MLNGLFDIPRLTNIIYFSNYKQQIVRKIDLYIQLFLQIFYSRVDN